MCPKSNSTVRNIFWLKQDLSGRCQRETVLSLEQKNKSGLNCVKFFSVAPVSTAPTYEGKGLRLVSAVSPTSPGLPAVILAHREEQEQGSGCPIPAADLSLWHQDRLHMKALSTE